MKILSKYKIRDFSIYCIRLESNFIGCKINSKYGIKQILGIEKFAINRFLRQGDLIGLAIDTTDLKEGDEIEIIT